MADDDLAFEAEIYSEFSNRLVSELASQRSANSQRESGQSAEPTSTGSGHQRAFSSQISIRPSDYESTIAERVVLQVSLGDSELQLEVPKCTLDSQKDATIFYRIPVGFGLWDAAHALTIHLYETKGDLSHLCPDYAGKADLPKMNGAKVMELGCGVAPLPALVCSKFGAKYAIATDYIDQLVTAAQGNIDRNLEALKQQNPKHGVIKTADLGWGDDIAKVCLNQDASEKFDIVLGADIIASTTVMETHVEIMKLLGKSLDDLTRPGSVVVLSHTIRMDDTEAWFLHEVLGDKFEKIGELVDDKVGRWKQYGRIAHNAKPGAPDRLVMVTLKKK